MAAACRPLILKAWPRQAWTRSSARGAALFTLPVAAIILAAIIDVGSRVRWAFPPLSNGAGSFVVGVEGPPWSLMRPSSDFHVMAPGVTPPGRTTVKWEPDFEFSVEHRILRMAAIVLTPVVTWGLLRWVIAPISLRRARTRLDASERRATKEAIAVLCAAIPLASALFTLLALAAIVAVQLLDPLWVLQWGGSAPRVAGAIYGGGLIGMPVVCWWLAIRGDTGHVIFPIRWPSIVLVSVVALASPLIAAALVSIVTSAILLQGA